MSIKLSIVEDQKDIREMLEALFKGSSNIQFQKSFADAESALNELPDLNSEVVLVDIQLPGKTGIDLIKQLSESMQSTQFIVCSSIEDSETIFEALRAGANGYILKSETPSKLVESVYEVQNGGSPISTQIARKVIGSFKDKEVPSSDWKNLSNREKEILDLLSKGFRYKEVAIKLFISTDTVRTHIRNIYEKLQVNSRTEALNKVYPRN
ncbi:MAG TPA: response regulator transcription factor [Bacteroidia bacterium]|nr:response regulator transcription factor [Bacteroidia bacterium]HNT79115.1 response regulator transcription factor [Bacteroidia bacterium]